MEPEIEKVGWEIEILGVGESGGNRGLRAGEKDFSPQIFNRKNTDLTIENFGNFDPMNVLRIRGYWILSCLLLAVGACRPTDYHTLPTFSPDEYVQAVIEIPAGSNHKIEYNKAAHAFEIEERNGRPRVINFLPYPGNYGFIPSTYLDPAKGGDGDALDVLVLAEAVPTQSVIEIIPIALLELMDGGEIDNKIIAVPANPEKQIIKASTLAELEAQYPAARNLISEWFLNYKGPGEMELVGWQDEQAAMTDIQTWLQTHP